MAILSYLVFPAPGKKNELMKELSALPNCDVIPAENRDLLVLVTESASKADNATFCLSMEAIPSLAGFSLVAGLDDNSPLSDD